MYCTLGRIRIRPLEKNPYWSPDPALYKFCTKFYQQEIFAKKCPIQLIYKLKS
jgi:hypothetical protein